MPSLLWKTDLNRGPVRVVSGRFVTLGGDIAASVESNIFLLVPENVEYRLYSTYSAGETVSGLAVIRAGFKAEGLAAVTPGRVLVLGNRGGALTLISQSAAVPGANFSDVAAGDLDGDGRDEIVAAAPGEENIYVYRLAGENNMSLELVGIRTVPGVPRYVTVFDRPEGGRAIAVAYDKDETAGLATYTLTEGGFAEGAGLTGQPLMITAMTSGNFEEKPGSELALGSVGGMVWVVGTGRMLEVLQVTDSLGTLVSTLASSQEDLSKMAAGTPEGNVFIFNYPVKRMPDQAFSPVEGVTGLAFLPGERISVGTREGGLQIWSLKPEGATWNYVVRPGDTLWTISKRYGVSVEQIISLNPTLKNPEVIMPGQVIKMPAG